MKESKEYFDLDKYIPHPLLQINEWINERYDRQYNTITMVLEWKKKDSLIWNTYDNMLLNDIYLQMAVENFRPYGSKDVPKNSIETVIYSSYTKKIHPINDYFATLKYNPGIDYINELSKCIFLDSSQDYYLDNKPQNDFLPIFLKRWFVHAYALSIGKNIGSGHVLLGFYGGQGVGKSTFLNSLLPKELSSFLYSGPIIPSITNYNTADLMAEKILINIDDQLDELNKKSLNDIKQLITLDKVTSTKKYIANSVTRPRIASFVASVNTREIFTDTENRRYMMFSIDTNKRYFYDQDKFNRIPLGQVWAQAKQLYEHGFLSFYSAPERIIINSSGQNYTYISLEYEWLMKCYAPVHEAEFGNDGIIRITSSEMFSNIKNISKLYSLREKEFKQAREKLGFKSKAYRSKNHNNNSTDLYTVKQLYEIDIYDNDKIRFINDNN